MYIKVTLTGMNDETNESDSQSTDTDLERKMEQMAKDRLTSA